MKDLKDRVAVITGGGSGIGRGIAHALAAQGVNIAIADIERAPAEAVVREVRAMGVSAMSVVSDVADTASLSTLADQVFDRFGQVHILCNNAGVFVGGPVAETPAAEWAWLFAVNVMGVVETVRAFLPRMRSQGGEAHIVNTGSISGLYATPGQGAYAASKYAVVGFSERLRVELEPEGIGVSVLCPSGVRTRIGESRRNRHEIYGGPVERPGQPPAAPNPNVMDPMDVGRLVGQGIIDNRLYIHTHLNVKPRYQERFEQILADFEPIE
jgi:NAD(P)-dependent dehydrogenase (short-subunit alcohol dehydrogenase family)